jgi:hypothetical protein
MLVPDIHRMTALARVKLPLFKHFGNAVNAAIKAGQRAGGGPGQFELGIDAPRPPRRRWPARGDFAGFGIGG